MKAKVLVGLLVTAGILGTAAAAWQGRIPAPFSVAHASADAPAARASAPAARPAAAPMAAGLPADGFTSIVADYGPAVVNVTIEGTTKVASNSFGFPDLKPGDPFYDFFRGFRNQAPQGGSVPVRGEGSGFIISSDGYILTNAHVVDHADEVKVRLTDRREFKAKVVGSDRQSDVALLKIDAKDLPTVKLGNSRDAQVGEWVVAIGSPYGFENSASAGIVSAKARSLPDSSYVPFIQTDVAVNPGNSGGPLFDLSGRVIGINSQIYSQTGGYQGLSFAIPIEVALNVKDQLLQHGHVTRGHLGVTVQEVNATLASSFGLDRPRGALVASVDPDSPAQKGGIKVGDIILKFNGNPIERSIDLPLLVANTPPGHRASIEVWRKGTARTLEVATNESKNQDVASNDESPANGGRLGLAVRPLTGDEKSEDGGKGGLMVEQVGGAAERAGVQPGDIVLALNGTPVRTVQELRDQVSKSGKHVALLIERNDHQLFVPVDLG